VIIGLTGKKQHGKDTVGGILVNEHGFVRVSYADALKESAAALFDVPVATWDALKNDPHAVVSLERAYGPAREGIARLTVREFLQRYGTESHRDVFGDNFWVNVAKAKMEAALDGNEDVVVTDVRFDNEAQAIHDLGSKYGLGQVVCVYRPQVVDDGDAHASEKLPEYDYVLWNGGDLDELRRLIEFDVLGRGYHGKGLRPVGA
jgi:hypothetical protein